METHPTPSAPPTLLHRKGVRIALVVLALGAIVGAIRVVQYLRTPELRLPPIGVQQH